MFVYTTCGDRASMGLTVISIGSPMRSEKFAAIGPRCSRYTSSGPRSSKRIRVVGRGPTRPTVIRISGSRMGSVWK